MHRSRPFVLVVLAALAACSKRDSSEGNDILSQDRTLVARIENDKASPRVPLPTGCAAIPVTAAPSTANQQQAEELTRQAGVAEMHGNIQDARSLLRRASDLDGTNKSAAYHLGRTSEALGDRASAMTAYCRYLALAPTAAESTEARQRVSDLVRSLPRATASATTTATDSVGVRRSVSAAQAPRTNAPRMTHEQSTAGSRVASAAVRRSTSGRSSGRVADSPSVVTSGEVRAPSPNEPPTTSAKTDDTAGSSTTGGDVVATSRPTPATEAPTTAPSTQRRSSIGVQSAILGTVTGAILGAATGRSVKSAVIGAAAGGVLGTVVGTTTRRGGRGFARRRVSAWPGDG